jgi:hypothetical protein
MASKRIGRTPFFFIGLLFLFVATLFVLIALFTSHWSKTASNMVTNVYNSYGLWFICSHYGREYYRAYYQTYQTLYGYNNPQRYNGWQPVPADNSCLPILYNYGKNLSSFSVAIEYFNKKKVSIISKLRMT